MAFDPGGDGLTPTEIERWLAEHFDVEQLDSAQGLYDLMPRQRGGQLPYVDVPYNPFSESHWADASRIADYIQHAPQGAQRVLDIGPGDGWPALPIASARADLEVVGVDPSVLRVRVCVENAARLALSNARFVVGDGQCLPFEDGAFDLLTAASSLEEASTPDAVLAECARVLRPGGVLRASSQDWRLGVPGFETVMLWEGGGTLFFTYVRRVQDPPLERRYVLALRSTVEAAHAHSEALVQTASARRAYGETLLNRTLGVPLLERLSVHIEQSSVVQLRRWSTAGLVEALRQAGFREARATVHPGELGRHFARDLLARNAMAPFAPLFDDATRALGRLAGSQPGEAMVSAVR